MAYSNSRAATSQTPGSSSSSIIQASAVRALQQELKRLREEPVEGFVVRLPDDANMFDWEVAIFGSPGSLYEGGYFKAQMKFPGDYPYSPPTVKFLSKMWHPNVYENGEVCISILHPPIDDPQSGELPCERWNPTQSVRTVLLSIISLLNEPNTSSPANVDASVAYRRWKESKGKDSFYEDIVRKQVLATRLDADKDGVAVPMTVQDYCLSSRPQIETQSSVDFDYEDNYSADGGDDSDSDTVSVEPSQSALRASYDMHEPARRPYSTDL